MIELFLCFKLLLNLKISNVLKEGEEISFISTTHKQTICMERSIKILTQEI